MKKGSRGVRPVMPTVPSVLMAFLWCAAGAPGMAAAQSFTPSEISGMVWVAGDTFLVVHDAKRPEELGRTRLSRARLPDADGGATWSALEVTWPVAAGPSHDLESIARVPGTNTYVLAESGDDEAGFHRLYVAEYSGALEDSVLIRDVVPWPVAVYNVEAIEIARLDTQLVFLFAERAQGRDQTEIAWAPFTLDPFEFGSFSRVAFSSIEPTGPGSRPVAALTIDSAGRLYVASTLDPDDDGGPFRSRVWDAGTLMRGDDGRVRVERRHPAQSLGTIDGFKVESLSVRERRPGLVELFIGTDDEHYGGTIRPLSIDR